MMFINTKALFAVAAFATSFQGVTATDCTSITDQTSCETGQAATDCVWDGVDTCNYRICDDFNNMEANCNAISHCLFDSPSCLPNCPNIADSQSCVLQSAYKVDPQACEFVPTKNNDGTQGPDGCLFLASINSGFESLCNSNPQTRWCTGTPVGGGADITTCNNPDKYFPPNNLYTWSCTDPVTGMKRNLRANKEGKKYTEGQLLLDTAGKV